MTKEQFRAILPAAKASLIEAFYYPFLTATAEAEIISTKLRLAHFLAQVGHECGDLRYQEEIADGHAYEGRKDLGNVRPGDGPRFKGHGLIQCTGRSNHEDYSEFTRQDFVSHPERIAAEPIHAVGVATWYWTRRRINLAADADDITRVTRLVNGGLTGLADRAARLARAKQVLGI